MKYTIKILLFVFCCLSAWTGFGQETFNIRTSFDYGGGFLFGVKEINNEYFTAGLFSNVQFNPESVVSKFDSDGTMLVQRGYGGADSFALYGAYSGLEQLNDTTLANCGYSFDENGTRFGYVMLYNLELDSVGFHTYYSPYLDLQADPTNDFIAPLRLSPALDGDGYFVVSNIDNEGDLGDAYILKNNSLGSLEWEHIVDVNQGLDRIYTLFETTADNIVFQTQNGNATSAIGRTVEINILTNQQTITELEIFRMAYDFEFNTEGGIIAGSTTLIDGEEGQVAYIFSTSMDGSTNWELFMGESALTVYGIQIFDNIEKTQDGHYIAAGKHHEEFEEVHPIDGARNVSGWLVKFTEDGDILWDRKYHFLESTGDKHEINDLIATSDGGYLFCGEARDFAPGTPNSEGPTQQGWIVKVDEHGCLVPDCHVGISETKGIEKQYFKSGPNPMRHFLNVYVIENLKQNAHFNLVNTHGQRVKSFSATSGQTTYMLDAQGLSNGTYILELWEGQQLLQREKVLKVD